MKKKTAYLKEIEIKYKIKKIKNDKYIGKKITDSAIVAKLFADLQNETKEKFITINLDATNKILCFEVVAIGTIGEIYVRPMEVFRTSVMINAYAAIIVHNHTNGDPSPSKDDKILTEKLSRLAKDMGLELYDHIIIGINDYYSFAKNDLL